MKQLMKRFRRQMPVWLRMLSFAREEYAVYLVILTGYFLAVTLLPFGAVLFPNRIIAQIEAQGSFSRILILAVGMALFYLVLRNLQNYCQKGGEVRGELLMLRLKMRLNRISMKAPMEKAEDLQFQNRKEAASQISFNSNYFNGYFYAAVKLLAALVQIAVILFLTRSLSVLVILLLVACFLCSLGYSTFFHRKLHEIEKKNAAVQRMMRYLENLIGDYHYGKMIRIHSMAGWLSGESAKKREEYCRNRSKEIGLEYRSRYLGSVLGGIQELLIYFYLIWMVIAQGISISEYVLYLAAVHQFSAALAEVAANVAQWNHYGYFAEDLVEFIRTEEKTETGGEKIAQKPVRITFEHVSFRYGKEGKWILQDLDFTIEKGEKVTLVGDNGAGKSTLLALLLRLYRPTQGRILVNGTDIWELEEESYSRLFAMVFQEYQTYAFTLKENILLGEEENAEEARLLEALRQSGFPLEKYENGLSTRLGKQFDGEAVDLSGGEQQKLAIARAIYRKSPVLILDEPTANLSPMAESRIYQKFYQMAEGRTAIFVSHRLSSSRFCDRVLVLEGGRITERGTHEELMERDGLYREMFQKQASFYREESHE